MSKILVSLFRDLVMKHFSMTCLFMNPFLVVLFEHLFMNITPNSSLNWERDRLGVTEGESISEEFQIRDTAYTKENSNLN